MADHVHRIISISPKYGVSNVVGYIEGKSALHLARMQGKIYAIIASQHWKE